MEITNIEKSFFGSLYSTFTKALILIVLLVSAIYVGNKNFIVYHTGIELFCVVIGFVMAIISINTYKLNKDNRIIFLGISFGFTALIDLMHLLSYRGLSIHEIFTFNISIQLWIVARYIQSISLLISFIFHRKKYSLIKVVCVFSFILVLIFISIFLLDIFPSAYIEDFGFTPFKIITGYVNCMVLLIGLVYFIKLTRRSKNNSDNALKVSMFYSIICELFFILSSISFDNLSILAHLFQFLSFYYIYIALVKSSLQDPHFSLISLNNTLIMQNQRLKSLVDMFKVECNERKKLEIESKQKTQIFNAILESVVDGILVIGDDDKVVHVNSQYKKMLNIPFEITCETSDYEIRTYIKKQIRDPEDFENHIKNQWRGKNPSTKNIYLNNGKVFEMSSVPSIDNNVFSGRLFIYRDITEKIKIIELEKQIEIRQASLEKAMEFDQLKTDFFCTVSHELKTPLNIILGVIQLISIGNKDNLARMKKLSSPKYINMIKQNCYRLIKLSNNLIDITKIDAGYTEMQTRNHNIVSVIEDITLSVAEYTKSKDISLVFDTDVEEKIISCDDEQLERVMLNLLSNAIKFTDAKGTISVDINDHGDYITISVTDSGIGIPKNKADTVFDRFIQVESTLKRQKEGSGIGLALVKSIIEKHEGKITLESELGKGSKFVITLPVKSIPNSEPAAETNEYNDMNVDRINIEFSDIYELNTYS